MAHVRARYFRYHGALSKALLFQGCIMPAKNAFYAQSGGVTSVINASAAAVIKTAKKYPDQIAKVYAGKNGILGALREEFYDTSQESESTITALTHTPGGALAPAVTSLKVSKIIELNTRD